MYNQLKIKKLRNVRDLKLNDKVESRSFKSFLCNVINKKPSKNFNFTKYLLQYQKHL